MRRTLPLILFFAGALSLLSILVPLAYSSLKFYALRPPHLINPLATSSVPGPNIVNILGVSSTDYSLPANWFVSPPSSPPLSSALKYFTLDIPRLKMYDVSVEINGSDLKKNAIHYPGTALPGSLGNSVVFGHSALPQFYQSGHPLTIFNPLVSAKIGDEILVHFDGITYRFSVSKIQEVAPTQVEVLSSHPSQTELTLITCVPLGTYWHRLVVSALLVQ